MRNVGIVKTTPLKSLVIPMFPDNLIYMTTETVEIPVPVLSSVETLDELQDWLTAQNPKIVAELRQTRKEDKAGKFKNWKPRYLACLTGSK